MKMAYYSNYDDNLLNHPFLHEISIQFSHKKSFTVSRISKERLLWFLNNFHNNSIYVIVKGLYIM